MQNQDTSSIHEAIIKKPWGLFFYQRSQLGLVAVVVMLSPYVTLHHKVGVFVLFFLALSEILLPPPPPPLPDLETVLILWLVKLVGACL